MTIRERNTKNVKYQWECLKWLMFMYREREEKENEGRYVDHDLMMMMMFTWDYNMENDFIILSICPT
jgi:hypothetical protein